MKPKPRQVRRAALTTAALAWLLVPSRASWAQGEVVAVPVTPDVAVVTGLGANMAVLRSGAGLVVVDSLISPLHAREARQAIAERFPGQPVRWLVNTHYHPDHQFGNQAYPEATVVAHARNAARLPGTASVAGQMARAPAELESRVAQVRQGVAANDAGKLADDLVLWHKRLARYAGFAPRAPDLVVDGDATVSIGGKTVRLIHPGRAHTDGDLAVLFVEDRVLVAGDLVFNRIVPVVDAEGGADVAGWVRALSRLGSLEEPFDRVVPGHGVVGGREILAGQARYLGDLLQAVTEARRSGLTLEQARRRVTLPAYAGYERVFGDVDGNVEGLWAILAREAGPGSTRP